MLMKCEQQQQNKIYPYNIYHFLCSTLHPEKLASKKFGYLACDR